MKKLFAGLLILLILLLSACTPDLVHSGGVVVHSTPIPTADIAESYANEDIVYVTKSGAKYHQQDCSFLKESKIPMSLEQAIQEGKEPCSRCFPVP